MTSIGHELLSSLDSRAYLYDDSTASAQDPPVITATLIHTITPLTGEHRVRTCSDRVFSRPATPATASHHNDTVNNNDNDGDSVVGAHLLLLNSPQAAGEGQVVNAPKNDFIISAPLLVDPIISTPVVIATTLDTPPPTMATSIAINPQATAALPSSPSAPAMTTTAAIPAKHVLVSQDWRCVSKPSSSPESIARRERAGQIKGNKNEVERQRTAILQPEDYFHVLDPQGGRHFVTDVGVSTALVQRSIYFEPSLGLLTHKTNGPEWVRTLKANIPKGPKGKDTYLAQHKDEFWPSCLFAVKPRKPASALANGSGQKRTRDDDDDDDDDDNEDDVAAVEGAAPAPVAAATAPMRMASLMGSNDELSMTEVPTTAVTTTTRSAALANGAATSPLDDAAQSFDTAFTRDQLDIVLGMKKPGLKAQDAWREYAQQKARLYARVNVDHHVTAPIILNPATANAAAVAAASQPSPTVVSTTIIKPTKPKAVAAAGVAVKPSPGASPLPKKPAAMPSKKPTATRTAPIVEVTDWFSVAFRMTEAAHRNNKLALLTPHIAASQQQAPELWETAIGEKPALNTHPYFSKFILPITAEVYNRYVRALDASGTGPSELCIPSKPFRDWFDVAILLVLQARNTNKTTVVDKYIAMARVENAPLFEPFGERTYKDMQTSDFYRQYFQRFVVPITAKVFERCVLPLVTGQQ